MFFLQIFDASYSLDMEHMSQTIILESSTLVWILKFHYVYDYLNLQNHLKLHLLFGVFTFCPTMGIRVFSERKFWTFLHFSRANKMRKIILRKKTCGNFRIFCVQLQQLIAQKKTCGNFWIFRVQTKCKEIVFREQCQIFAIRFPLFAGNPNRNWLFRKIWERTTV